MPVCHTISRTPGLHRGPPNHPAGSLIGRRLAPVMRGMGRLGKGAALAGIGTYGRRGQTAKVSSELTPGRLMLWGYFNLLQSFRRPTRALDWIAYLIPFAVMCAIGGGGGVAAAVFAMRHFGNWFLPKFLAGAIALLAGWAVMLVLNVQLFRLSDWVYDRLSRPVDS